MPALEAADAWSIDGDELVLSSGDERRSALGRLERPRRLGPSPAARPDVHSPRMRASLAAGSSASRSSSRASRRPRRRRSWPSATRRSSASSSSPKSGPGEPYRPIDVEAIFDEETVSLRGPWRSNDLVEIGPSADDLGRGLYEYNLDFPGDALNPAATTSCGRAGSPRTPSRSTPTSRRRPPTPTGSRSSTGSTTPSTTGTTCTRATGR